jgi:excinuclease UvrABC ATPase subunit
MSRHAQKRVFEVPELTQLIYNNCKVCDGARLARTNQHLSDRMTPLLWERAEDVTQLFSLMSAVRITKKQRVGQCVIEIAVSIAERLSDITLQLTRINRKIRSRLTFLASTSMRHMSNSSPLFLPTLSKDPINLCNTPKTISSYQT